MAIKYVLATINDILLRHGQHNIAAFMHPMKIIGAKAGRDNTRVYLGFQMFNGIDNASETLMKMAYLPAKTSG